MAGEIVKTARIENRTENLRGIRDFVQGVLEQSLFSPVQRNQIILAADEAVANIIEHGYEGNTGDIEIFIRLDDSRIEITVRDQSAAFDPTQIARADVLEHIKRGKKKGLGMFLMRKIMDEIIYSYDGRNELRMVKNVNSGGTPGGNAQGSPS